MGSICGRSFEDNDASMTHPMDNWAPDCITWTEMLRLLCRAGYPSVSRVAASAKIQAGLASHVVQTVSNKR